MTHQSAVSGNKLLAMTDTHVLREGGEFVKTEQKLLTVQITIDICVL
jgi:hypothetical protein